MHPDACMLNDVTGKYVTNAGCGERAATLYDLLILPRVGQLCVLCDRPSVCLMELELCWISAAVPTQLLMSVHECGRYNCARGLLTL